MLRSKVGPIGFQGWLMVQFTLVKILPLPFSKLQLWALTLISHLPAQSQVFTIDFLACILAAHLLGHGGDTGG